VICCLGFVVEATPHARSKRGKPKRCSGDVHGLGTSLKPEARGSFCLWAPSRGLGGSFTSLCQRKHNKSASDFNRRP
jgi:hypothetical protein